MRWLLFIPAAMLACTAPPQTPRPSTDAADDTAVDAAIDLGPPDLAVAPSDMAVDLTRTPDATPDADAMTRDMATPDAAPDLPMPCVPPPILPPVLTAVPLLLSETGLYVDVPNEVLADGVRAFAPAYPLWSDGATKDRFVWLPPCEQIDNTDQDHWSFPVGTRLWKTFTRDGVRIETRLITRFGPAPTDYHFAAYLWRDDGTDADFVEFGVVDAKGTPHDVPAIDNCEACHGHLPEPPLGFGAIMLSHAGPGVTIAQLSSEGTLAVPAPAGFQIPGNDIVRNALGYLHANCSNCHNETAGTIPFLTPFSLRTSVTELTPADTGPYRTAVGQFVTRFIHPDCVMRIDPGSPASSCVYVRMSLRGGAQQMPLIGTEIVHPEGLTAISDWITSLP